MSCELILKAANTWMTANPVIWQSALNSASNLMEEESKREKIELANYDYILTPLLRVPYWISPHSLGYSGTKCITNLNHPCLPYHKTDLGPVLDPTFNMYCILANMWQVPSITIPIAFDMDHPMKFVGSWESIDN